MSVYPFDFGFTIKFNFNINIFSIINNIIIEICRCSTSTSIDWVYSLLALTHRRHHYNFKFVFIYSTLIPLKIILPKVKYRLHIQKWKTIFFVSRKMKNSAISSYFSHWNNFLYCALTENKFCKKKKQIEKTTSKEICSNESCHDKVVQNKNLRKEKENITVCCRIYCRISIRFFYFFLLLVEQRKEKIRINTYG